MLTHEQLETTFNATGSIFKTFVSPLQEAMDHYAINNTHRKAAFLAQTGYESGLFRWLVENLNYSAEALMKTFPTHFNKYNVGQYAHKPEAIANRLYAERLGNGEEPSGDGFKYRGRGLIQITGKFNYEQ